MSRPDGRFNYLYNDPLPPLMVQEALKLYGTHEGIGTADNPVILAWTLEIARAMHGFPNSVYADWVMKFYKHDSIAWCALFQAICAVRSAGDPIRPERLPPNNFLAAAAWSHFGQPVAGLSQAIVGDLAILQRPGGGHVTQIVAVQPGYVGAYGLGGNQGDQVCIEHIPGNRIVAIRRPIYLSQPDGARRVVLSASGIAQTSEG